MVTGCLERLFQWYCLRLRGSNFFKIFNFVFFMVAVNCVASTFRYNCWHLLFDFCKLSVHLHAKWCILGSLQCLKLVQSNIHILCRAIPTSKRAIKFWTFFLNYFWFSEKFCVKSQQKKLKYFFAGFLFFLVLFFLYVWKFNCNIMSSWTGSGW